MTSPVDICNLALDAITAKAQISGINPPLPAGSLAAQACSRAYQLQYDAVLCAANWNDGRQQDQLELIAAAQGTPENPDGTSLPLAPFPWRYLYAYPQGCVRFRFVLTPPQATASDVPIMTNASINPPNPVPTASAPYVVGIVKDQQGNQIKAIMTNVQAALGVWSGRVENPHLWSPLFLQAVIAALAAWLVNPVARNKDMMAEKTQMAGQIIMAARVADANEGVTSVDHLPDFLAVRGVGGGYYGGMEGAISGVAGYPAPWDAWIGPNGISY